jgi:uncharacterized protein YjiS (DUF1127 family)
MAELDLECARYGNFPPVAGVIRGWSQSFSTWRARRRAIAELRSLGDRALKDLGLHGSEASALVRGGPQGRKRPYCGQ